MMGIEILIAVLIQVESSGIDTAVGDHGRSVGCLQIQSGVIEDVNRVYKTNYTLDDRTCRSSSIEICKLYLKHWGEHYQRKTGQPATAEVLSRIWNGGPNGWKKKATDKYWNKVRRLL